MEEMAKSQKTSGKAAVSKGNTKKRKKKMENSVESGLNPEIAHFKTRQNTEVRRLRKIYKDLPESQKILVSKLLARSAYVNSKLEATEAKLDEEGLIVDFENGSQVIKRVNPNLRAYMDLLKIYNSIIEQVDDMIRHDRDIAKRENQGDTDDQLIAFINARR